LKDQETKSVNGRLDALKAIIRSDILLEHAEVKELSSRIGDALPSYLMKTDGEVRVKPWLKTRLFETILASTGMDEYLKELLSHDDAKAEDVPINPLLASFLISTSMNPFVFELINQLVSSKKVNLTKGQIDALSVILKPSKDYTISKQDVSFQSEPVQNTRIELLRMSLDILSAYEKDKSVDYRKTPAIDRVPEDLERVTYVPDFTIEELLLISKRCGLLLKLAFIDGYLVWQYRDQPAIYVKSGEACYSPKHSQRRGTTTYEQADRQVYHFIDQLESSQLPSVRCAICGQRSTSNLFYHRERGVVPLCKECSKDDQMVVGFVSKLRHKD